MVLAPRPQMVVGGILMDVRLSELSEDTSVQLRFASELSEPSEHVKPGKGKSADDSLNPCYYHNALLGLTQWQHPHLTYLMALAAELGGEKKGGGRPPAARDVFGE